MKYLAITIASVMLFIFSNGALAFCATCGINTVSINTLCGDGQHTCKGLPVLNPDKTYTNKTVYIVQKRGEQLPYIKSVMYTCTPLRNVSVGSTVYIGSQPNKCTHRTVVRAAGNNAIYLQPR